MTLTEFLLARIAEDESDAANVHDVSRCGAMEWGGNTNNTCDCGWPEGVLAECEAKWKIVALHEHLTAPYPLPHQAGDVGCDICSWNTSTGGMEYEPNGWCATLRLVALPYADHPDYREEWRP